MGRRGKTTLVEFSAVLKPSLRHRVFGELQKAMQLNANGSVSWGINADVDEYVSVLGDAFEFPSDLSRREAASAIFRGIIGARKNGEITDSTVLRALQQFVDERLARRPRQFSMWSRLGYRPDVPMRHSKFAYSDVSMQLTGQLPSYMELSELELRRLRPIETKDIPGFGYLIARTRARNRTHAADKIFEATELFLAMYNLALKQWNITGSEQRPEAPLLLGPYHFLFEGRKPLVEEELWFNQNFRDSHWHSCATASKKVFESASIVKTSLAKLQSHPLRKPISTALLMMNDGMEAADMTRRTLRYWTALEQLFQAGDERVSYDKIIDRATYLAEPRDLAKAKLNRLRRIRNLYVHIGSIDNEHHQLTQYLADQVRSHLFYLLFHGDDFADHREFIEMTDLPCNIQALERRRRAIDRRERMIERRRHRSD